MSPYVSNNQKAFSLMELLIVGAIGAIVTTGIMRFQSNLTRRNLENSARSSAQTELDDFALRLRKDFERHSIGTGGIQLLPAGAPYRTPTNGTQPCQNLTILQTVLGTGASTTSKIRYQTQCLGESFPAGFQRSSLHTEFTTAASCSLAPKVTRSFWQNSASTGAGADTVFPSPRVKGLALCVRPNAAVNPSLFGAEMSVAYKASDGSWKVLQKSLTLAASEFGTSGIEIISPQ